MVVPSSASTKFGKVATMLKKGLCFLICSVCSLWLAYRSGSTFEPPTFLIIVSPVAITETEVRLAD